MAKKQNSADEGFLYLFLAAIGIIGLPLFINTYFVRKHFARKYAPGSGETRVTEETGNIVKNFAIGAAQLGLLLIISVLLLLSGIGLAVFSQQPVHFIFGIILSGLGLLSLGCCFGLSARLATTQIGLLVFPAKGTFVIPADTAKNTFTENILQGKLFLDQYAMEELPLADITKITREGGKKVFIHGKFGTRCIKWGNKQKRDECISTLERACKKRLVNYDFGY